MNQFAEYVGAGLALCPIVPGSKGPRLPGWQTRERAITSTKDAARLKGAGLLHAWSRTCAIDVDDLHGASEWLSAHGVELAELLAAGDAVQIKSGRPNRAKLVYRLPKGLEPLPSKKIGGASGVLFELRCAAENGLSVQDVLPPSVHPDTGKPYTWAGAGDWRHLPELPREVLALWQSAGEGRSGGTGRHSAPGHPIPAGSRNDQLFRMGCQMRGQGWGEAAILGALVAENKERCRPPLPSAEVRVIARQAARYDEGSAPVIDLNALAEEAPARKSKKRALPALPPARSFDAADLLEQPMAEPNYIVRPFVPEGVTLWCGRPKLGKTTALRQLAHQANIGGEFLGEPCTAAEVWFLSLEEGERVMRKKLAQSCPNPEELRGVRLEFEWPQGAAGVELLREKLRTRTGVRPVLLIVDSLTRFRQPVSERANAFTEDYNAVKLLADLAKEFAGLAIVVLHHTTKAVPDDPVSSISGTYGLSAAADSYCVMLKQGQQYRLHAGGRLWDRDESDFELQRHGGGWTLLGAWDHTAPQGLTPKQQDVMTLLRGGAKSNKTLADSTGQSPSALAHMLKALEARGLIERIANGWGLAR